MAYYDDISEGYEELHREEQLKKVEEIKKYINIKPSDKLLDVGCGTGLTTVCWGCRPFGIDPSIKLLERAHREQKNVFYVNAEAEHIPFKDNYFDWVISVTAIQNFHDIEAGLKEIKRVGKGRFVLSFLKKSHKKEMIIREIEKDFNISYVIKESKDLIFIVNGYMENKVSKASRKD